MSDIEAKLYRGWWYAVWRENGATRRTALRTQDREDAERRLIDFRRSRAAPAGSLTGDIVEAYLADRDRRIRNPERLCLAWKRAKPIFGHLRPDQITAEVSDTYIAKRKMDGVGDATILKEINVVRQALNWRGVKGATFEAPPAPPPRDRYLTRPEFKRLIESCIQPHVRLFIILALVTAGRKTAVLQLTWDRVDFERGMIRLGVVGERNRKGRAVVPMNDRARQALTEARAIAQTPYVVEYAGSPVLDIKKGFAAAVKRAGLHDVTPHDLRHSAAVWMAEDGVPLVEIAQYLGHTDPTITYRVYSRFSPTHLRKAAASLDF